MNDDKQNPYAAPKSKLERFDLAKDFKTFKPLSLTGRLARLRYISFTLGTISIALILSFFIAPMPIIGTILSFVFFIVAVIINIIFSAQRCRDFNLTGWLGLFYLIPLISLILYFIPGTNGSNNYGNEPPQNSIAVVITAILFLIIYGLSILSLSTYFLIGSV